MPTPDVAEVAARFLRAANAGAWGAVVADIHPATASRLRSEALWHVAATLELRRLSASTPAGMIGVGFNADDIPGLLARFASVPVPHFPEAPTVGMLEAMPIRDFLILFLAGCDVRRPRHLLAVVPFGSAAAFAVWTSEPPTELDADRFRAQPTVADLPSPECLALHFTDDRWWAVPDRWMMLFAPSEPGDRGPDEGSV